MGRMLLLPPMLSVHKLGLSFGGTDLFKDISFQVALGQRLGLVGRNGAGKSTLLRLIAGDMSPDKGKINTPTDFKIGFLTQDIPIQGERTVWDECATSFGDIQQLEIDMEDMTTEMAQREDFESQGYMDLIDRFHKAQEHFQHIGGYTYQADMEKVLMGLGFLANDFHKRLDTFSGGWQMRVELAKILLQQNDLLLLDEPTNHLDLESILWLEQFLSESPQAIILVSHDRTFLNNATNRTLEIVMGKSYDYPVPYYKYLVLREEIREKQRQAKVNQDKEIKQTKMLIEKFRYKASKAAFAQSLIKQLARMDVIEVDDEDKRQMRVKFPPSPHSGKVVVDMKNIHKHYGEKHVLKGLDMELSRGQKVAFVGQNGQGKTTLVKIMAEALKHEGSLVFGHQVKLSYYAQDQAEVLDGNLTVLQTIEDSAPENMRPQVRKLLGNFMFQKEDVEKKVKVLSGGERGRLALCQLMLNPMNLLILDEPTNHLDMVAKDVLKEALKLYDGTLILVSHDREFLEGLADMTYEFKDGKVKQYLGGIAYFLEKRKLDSMRELDKKAGIAKQAKADSGKVNQKAQRAQLRDLEKAVSKARRQSDKAEQAYEALQEQLDAMNKVLADPEAYKKASSDPAYYQNYEALQGKVEEAFNAWEEAVNHLKTQETELASSAS